VSPDGETWEGIADPAFANAGLSDLVATEEGIVFVGDGGTVDEGFSPLAVVWQP
jgi:hypothetical protein